MSVDESTNILRIPVNDRLGYQLRRASVALMAELARNLAAFDLTIVEATILVTIEANPLATQSDIARALGLKRANTPKHILKLESLGLVDRVQVDGRSQGLKITAYGRELAASVDHQTWQRDQQFFKDDPDPEELMKRLHSLWAP